MLDRIGGAHDIDIKLFQLQTSHWHDRASSEDNYTTLKEARQRHQGEGDAAMAAAKEEIDFMLGKVDGVVRLIAHDVKDLLAKGKIKSRKDVLKGPKLVIKKKMKPHPTDKARKVFDQMRVRATAPGHLSKEFIHFDPNRTSSPVMQQCSFVLILILTVIYDLDLFMCDDSKAFVFGVSEFEYYVWLPEVIRDDPEYATYGTDTVWEPVSSWYGTKSASAEYHSATVQHVTSTEPGGMQMQQSQRDPAVFIRWFDTANMLMFGSHVDDKLGCTHSLPRLYKKWFLPAMNKHFITNDVPDIDYMLGANVKYDKGKHELVLSHETAITAWMDENHMSGMAPKATPCSMELLKRVEATPMASTEQEIKLAHTLRPVMWKYIGWAGHIARTTIPWAITAINVAAKYMSNPQKVHLELVLHILSHFLYVVKNKLWRKFKRPTGFDSKKSKLWCIFMVDSDHRGNKSGTSNSGLAVFICNMFLWGSRKAQKCITLNTCESEFMAMSSGGQFAIWFILFLQELKFPIDYPAAILGDNTAAIQTHYNPGTTKYARHIDLRSKFVARMLEKRDYVIAYINTHTNVSDAFTKILEPKAFTRFMLWMANGLDSTWDGEVVGTLERLFQECKMREKALTSKEKQLALKQNPNKRQKKVHFQ